MDAQYLTKTAYPSTSEHFSPCLLVLTVYGPQVSKGSNCLLLSSTNDAPTSPQVPLCSGPLVRKMPLLPFWSSISRWAELLCNGQGFMHDFKLHIASVRNQSTIIFLLFLSRHYSWMRRLVDSIQGVPYNLPSLFPKHNSFRL